MKDEQQRDGGSKERGPHRHCDCYGDLRSLLSVRCSLRRCGVRSSSGDSATGMGVIELKGKNMKRPRFFKSNEEPIRGYIKDGEFIRVFESDCAEASEVNSDYKDCSGCSEIRHNWDGYSESEIFPAYLIKNLPKAK